MLSSQKNKKLKKKPSKESLFVTGFSSRSKSRSKFEQTDKYVAERGDSPPSTVDKETTPPPSGVRFLPDVHDRPNSESPPPSNGVVSSIIPGSPGLLRNKSFDHHDRVKLTKNKKSFFNRTKSIERVFSHQVVIESDEVQSGLPPLAPSTSSKKKHFVRRKSIEQLVMSTLSLRTPRSSASTDADNPVHPSTAAHASVSSSKKSNDTPSHSTTKKSNDALSHAPSKQRGNDAASTKRTNDASLSKKGSTDSSSSDSPKKKSSSSHTRKRSGGLRFTISSKKLAANAAAEAASANTTPSPQLAIVIPANGQLGTYGGPHPPPPLNLASAEHECRDHEVANPFDTEFVPSRTISVPDIPDSLKVQLQNQLLANVIQRGRGRSNSTIEDTSPRLARLLSPSRRPSIEDLKGKHIWIDADQERARRRQVSDRLTRFFETMYADPYAKPLPIFLDQADNAKHLLAILDQHVLSYAELQIDSPTPFAEGAYSQVFRAQFRGELVAVKRLRDIARYKAAILRAFEREVISLKRTAHLPQVITFLGACVHPHYCIVTALQCGGSLHDALYTRRCNWSTAQKMSIASRVASGVAALHALSPPLLHRDLTTLNIFMGENDIPFIGDFGISRFRTADQPTSPIGHPRWKAPEIHRISAYTTAADVYMLGTIIFEIFYKKKALDPALTDREVSKMLASGFVPSLPPDDGSVPPFVSDLILWCWSNDPSVRPPASYVASHLSNSQTPVNIGSSASSHK